MQLYKCDDPVIVRVDALEEPFKVFFGGGVRNAQLLDDTHKLGHHYLSVTIFVKCVEHLHHARGMIFHDCNQLKRKVTNPTRQTVLVVTCRTALVLFDDERRTASCTVFRSRHFPKVAVAKDVPRTLIQLRPECLHEFVKVDVTSAIRIYLLHHLCNLLWRHFNTNSVDDHV